MHNISSIPKVNVVIQKSTQMLLSGQNNMQQNDEMQVLQTAVIKAIPELLISYLSD